MTKQIIEKNNQMMEQGRSMVEMLGVLAIVGVLSIAGISGYRIALNRYRANEIFDGITKRLILAVARHTSGDINLPEFSNDILGYETYGWCHLGECGFWCSLFIRDLPKELCSPLKSIAENVDQYDMYVGCGGDMIQEFNCANWGECGATMFIVDYWED